MYKRIDGIAFELWLGSSMKTLITREKKRIKDILPGKQSKVRQLTLSYAKRYGTGVHTEYELLVDTKTYNKLRKLNISPS